MQTSSINNLPSKQLLNDLPESTSPKSFPPETSPHQPKSRWVTLFLLCASTFGVQMFSSILLSAQNEISKTFQVDPRIQETQTQTIERITWFVPLIAGLAIHRFGINKAYRFFMRSCAVGTLLVASRFQIQSSSLYFWGELMIKGSIHGLWVTQMEILLKCFKGKEPSLAIAIVGWSKCVVAVLGSYFYSFLNGNKLPLLLCFGIVFCFLGDLALNFMTKAYMTVKEEDEKSILEEDIRLNKPALIALFITILCFRVADSSKIVYMSLITGSPSSDAEFIFQFTSTVPPIVIFSHLGIFVDRFAGRTAGVFFGFVMLFAGNILFFFLLDHQKAFIPCLSLIPLQFGLWFFEFSSWAILGVWTRRKNLGVVLGSVKTLECFLGCFCDSWLPKDAKYLFFGTEFVLVVGIGFMFYAWRESVERKIEAAKRNKL